MQKTTNTKQDARSPVVVIMGHIDHGKSTLLSYIRKSKRPLSEAGDITQHISAYEVTHDGHDGKSHLITFLDTPGHEAFSGIRKRGANVSDIAVLVVSAEDGVKKQTLEALSSIKQSNTPYIVAINKIDKPEANIEKTKQSLVENEIYIEGYGGDVPVVPLSAKTGEGVPELLDMILLMTELAGLTGDRELPAVGVVIESNMDGKKGITSTCIVKNGTLKKGMFVTSGLSTAPIRIIEDFSGKPVQDATFSSPVRIIGWDSLPEVGATFVSWNSREEAKQEIEKEIARREENNKKSQENRVNSNDESAYISLIVKADTGSSLEAVISEIKKLDTEKVKTKVISSGVGTVSENDVRLVSDKEKTFIVGFNTKIDSPAKNLAERNEIQIQNFEIIYKMSEWLKEVLIKSTPKMQVMESVGRAKILKLFSKTKNKQVLGGRVDSGEIKLDAIVKIIRRDSEIGEGRIKELQQQRVNTKEVPAGKEFGAVVQADLELAVGDYIEAFITIEK